MNIENENNDQSASIAKLNDLLRDTMITGQVTLTEGVASLQSEVRESIISKVRTFSDFTEDNDPYGERDFGSFEVDDVGTINWKIDYFDLTMQFLSEDPADPKKTKRVLTIMLSSEY